LLGGEEQRFEQSNHPIHSMANKEDEEKLKAALFYSVNRLATYEGNPLPDNRIQLWRSILSACC
jgi:hypothetical protein